MSIKYGIVFTSLILIFYGCSQKRQFPAKKSEKVAMENVVLNHPFLSDNKTEIKDSVQTAGFAKELNELLVFKKYYEVRNEQFDLLKLVDLWNKLENRTDNFNFEGVAQWIEVTEFLFEITDDPKYAQAMEDAVYQAKLSLTEAELKEIEKLVTPFIFTKNVDHIHVNLFANATVKYNHTLKGAVEITQETGYPESGKVQLTFKMEKKRYIELFIRIPEWAEGATVTEKGVKYVAIPGQYCLVARNWNAGDFVEINFPIEKMPKR